MKRALLLFVGLFCWLLISFQSPRAKVASRSSLPGTNVQKFQVTGVVKELKADHGSAVIEHGAISNYMPAMRMSFKVKDTNQLAGLQNGERISFRLLVTPDESWIDHVTRLSSSSSPSQVRAPALSEALTPPPTHPLMNYPFTNELGQAVSLASFRGQALGITFFFTRCPIPEYCPRLSRNFEEASQKLAGMGNAPTNWHLLSVSIDPQMDTPAVLQAYGRRYHYDPRHWSFLTGPAEKVRELASQSGVTYEGENGLVNHNFRTLIIDATGGLQMNFPIGGNLSESIVTEILKAAAVTNK